MVDNLSDPVSRLLVGLDPGVDLVREGGVEVRYEPDASLGQFRLVGEVGEAGHAPARGVTEITDDLPEIGSSDKSCPPAGRTVPVDDARELADLETLVEKRGHE